MWAASRRKASGILLAIIMAAIIYVTFTIISQPTGSWETPALASGVPLPDFTLTDQHGRRFSLSESRGKVVLLFFGYTNCPDVCPMVLSKYGELEGRLGSRVGDVVMLLVTTDPARDDASTLREYVSRYGDHIIALTGDWEEMVPIWARYHVRDVGDGLEKPKDNYYIAHSAVVYVADRDLVLRHILTPEMPTSRYLDTILKLLQ
ncbi:MAG: SCO family protein [Nitrososphaerota archaeon]